jgi:hypothetical protein
MLLTTISLPGLPLSSFNINPYNSIMEYQPLDFATFEIRLLTILDGEVADKVSGGDVRPFIRCSLHHTRLIEPPQYRALSYCWGDPLVTKPIIVNGCVMQVTANLEAALRELKAQQLKVLWVDALCINQSDTVERGIQVTRMGHIYSRAYEVIAWLGVEADDSRSAFHILRWL